ncbi:Fur family transcriptional regulator [Nocardioides acrostichi]|uniref:Transcriptional repressor n=1 Tax=Nocardioides acrostichi TaxID=2784339 RepID=A0A930V2E3_9ACTN|nr:transcriptional repressor [Nocardioides acrostichi]MBF4162764.1 transcriptional repressor [Nocardioides acrostichi]
MSEPVSSATSEPRRDTPQRRLVRDRLASSDSFASAQQLFDGLRSDGEKIGLATVYRTLQAMTDAGEVDTVRTDEGEAMYRMCGTAHHHHLICRDCGLTVEIEGPSVERWATQAAQDHGFTDVTHVVELFGRCASCSGH